MSVFNSLCWFEFLSEMGISFEKCHFIVSVSDKSLFPLLVYGSLLFGLRGNAILVSLFFICGLVCQIVSKITFFFISNLSLCEGVWCELGYLSTEVAYSSKGPLQFPSLVMMTFP